MINTKPFACSFHLNVNNMASFFLDAAFVDMDTWEQEMLKIVTMYINGEYTEIVTSYKEEMLMRRGKRTNLHQISFLSQEIDRAQILMELFEHEKNFNAAKINVVNLLMDVYENSVNTDEIAGIRLWVLSILFKRPRFQLQVIRFRCNERAFFQW